MDIIQYNAMHKFVGVLDNPPKWVVMGDVASEMGVALTWKAMPGMARVLTLVQKTAVPSGPTSGPHTANEMQLIPIEKISSIRGHRNFFLIQKGRTMDPDGLNIHEESDCSLTCYVIIFF